MYKRLLLTFLVALSFTPCLLAQNIQLHYDFGRALYDELNTRPHLTSTVEDFIVDKWGSTYFFIDMDYNHKGVASAYWELDRELKFWNGPLSVHVEYDGGNVKNLPEEYNIRNAYLAGVTYTYNNKDYSAGFTFTPMYKYIQGQQYKSYNSFQLTATWYLNLANRLITLSGFADFWREVTAHGKTIFLSEPQFWLNLNKIKGVDKDFNLSLGSETEFSNNFAGRDGFYAIPTIAVKWTFK